MEPPHVADDEPVTPLEWLPRPVLAVGPLVVMALVAAMVYLLWPFDDLEAVAAAGTVDILLVLTIIGAIAGIVPVAIGMLWFPFIRSVEPRHVHAFIALATGVLAFIAIEMTEGMIGAGGEADRVATTTGVAIVGVLGTFGVMYWISAWRQQATAGAKSGLQIAYLVAIALGLHSIGEGLAIGVSLVQGEAVLVMLLVVGFVVHNILEGLTCVAAMARDQTPPRLWHFALIGVIAGGPVILGGWFGSAGTGPVLAVAFYAIAIGAILQAIVEMVDLVRLDAGTVFSRLNLLALGAGFALMLVLEELIVEGWLLPG